MYVTLKGYLAGLKDLEKLRAEGEQRDVPSLTDLARAAGIHPMTISRWVGGGIQATNHETIAAIIAEMRRRGFNTEVSDILAYQPPEKQPA